MIAAILLFTIAIDSDMRAVAALPGEPSLVSAGGITRRDVPMSTLENPSTFEPVGTAHRLVLVGGLDGDEASAHAVIDTVRWMKTRAPASVRRSWIVSAMPLARPDTGPTPLEFPPLKGFFDDPDAPESRYLWRWLSYQAPDHVVIFSAPQSQGAASLRQALSTPSTLSSGQQAGLGAVSASIVNPSIDAFRGWLTSAGKMGTSRLRDTLAKRVAREPAVIAQLLARRYPESPAISYIPSVAWVNTLRLAAITGDESLRTRVREQTKPWITGEKALFGDRIQLTAVAGTMVFADLAAGGDVSAQPLAARGAELALKTKDGGGLEYGGGWTDDMFMASSIVSRMSPGRAAPLLIEYANRLQRPDGLFGHAPNGPIAWGRGNGFAAFGLLEALTTMPSMKADDPQRTKLLDIYRRLMSAVRSHQAPDGSFREVIDEPGAYREESATAMLFTAMARGIRLGWIDRSFLLAAQRAWRALAAHIAEDGTIVDVCTSTGGGPTLRYYLDRAAITGADDRGGAMALAAAVEMLALISQ
jgi:unsaturated rhamnogalacturonyl hydrolase